jgi:hypothetical protein
MTRGNKLTRPWSGPGTQTQVAMNGILTHFTWNFNSETNQWEIVKVMPEGQDDLVEFSDPSKPTAESELQRLLDRDYPGLRNQR